MTERDAIRDVFFDECEDLLSDLHEGLLEMQGGSTDDECINAVFRAVHSIKGGAGAFGLDSLVDFAHTFETALDQLRDGQIDLDDNLLQTFLPAGDMLADLISAARAGTIVDESAATELSLQLKNALADAPAADHELSFETLAADLDFDLDLEPVPSVAPDSTFPPSTGVSEKAWIIRFRPLEDFYSTGNEPLAILKALTELGEAIIETDVSDIPGPESFDWTTSYLRWTISIRTHAPKDAISEIFEFVEGLCKLEIEPADHDPDQSQVSKTTSRDSAPLDRNQLDVSKDNEETAEAQDKKKIAPRHEPPATLRVEVERIDNLVNTVGELIINQAMLSQRIRDLDQPPPPELMTDLEDYKQLARNVQEGVMDLRMQPIRQLFQRMNRIARETANTANKKILLELEGEETKVDKKVIEKLADPLTHMVRNAIDHGVEDLETRISAGKPAQGHIRLKAQHKSGHVVIQIIDDGGGLNRRRIRETAEKKGLVEQSQILTEAEVDNLLFAPGFSTASTVTSLSGRGVGMDVVKTSITALGGRISIASQTGLGSTFTIVLPLTLAVLDGMVVCVGDEMMVVPIAAIEEAIRPKKNDISKVGFADTVFSYRGDYLPVVDLGTHLGNLPTKTKLTKRILLVLKSDSSRVALAVDRVLDKRQVVIKNLAKNYRSIPGISAATILGDGKVALIVDPEPIADIARIGKTTGHLSSKHKEKPYAA